MVEMKITRSLKSDLKQRIIAVFFNFSFITSACWQRPQIKIFLNNSIKHLDTSPHDLGQTFYLHLWSICEKGCT